MKSHIVLDNVAFFMQHTSPLSFYFLTILYERALKSGGYLFENKKKKQEK